MEKLIYFIKLLTKNHSLKLVCRLLFTVHCSLFTAQAQDKPELVIPSSHEKTIVDFVISKDNNFLITASDDKTIRVWDMRTGDQLKKIETGDVKSVDISLDNKYIITGGKSTNVWEIRSGKKVFSLSNGESTKVVYSEDGKNVFSCEAYPGGLKNWQLVNGFYTEKSDHRIDYPVWISDDGYVCYYSNYDVSLKKFILISYNLKNKKEIGTIDSDLIDLSREYSNNGKYVLANKKSPDNRNFSLEEKKSLVLWDMTNERKILETPPAISILKSFYFSPDSKYFVHLTKKNFMDIDIRMDLWDIENKTIIKTTLLSNIHSGFIDNCKFSDDGNYLYLTGSDISNIYVWNINDWKMEKKIKMGNSTVGTKLLHPVTNNLIINNDHLDLMNGRIIKQGQNACNYLFEITNDGNFATGANYLPGNTWDTIIKVFDMSNNKILKTISMNLNDAFSPLRHSFSVFSEKKLMSFVFLQNLSERVIKTYDINSLALKHIIKGNPYYKQIILSQDGKYALAWNESKYNDNVGEFITSYNVISIEDAKVLFKKEIKSMSSINEGIFLNDGQRFLLFSRYKERDLTKLKLDLMDINTNNVVQTIGYFEDFSQIRYVSKDSRYAVITCFTTGNVKVVDLNNPGNSKTLTGFNSYISNLFLTNDNKYLIGVGNSKLMFWEVASEKELLTYYPMEDNNWVLTTPDGRFDASEGGMKMLYFVQGLDVLPLESFYEKLYTPKLWASVMAGQAFEKPNIDITQQIQLPPAVIITSPENNSVSSTGQITITVEVTDQGGGIDEIRLFHNGKLVETTNRGFKPVSSNGLKDTKTYSVELLPGENIFKATAFNTQRTEANPDEITVNYQGASATADLYLFAIGINSYKNSKYSLNYALPDAQAFSKEIETKSTGIFANVKKFSLQDSEATKENIISKFSQIKASTRQQDVFVFYYAGHGVMSEGGQNDKADFFLVPYDVTMLYGDDNQLVQKGISSNELMKLSQEIKAQKQLFVLDACQSGGALEAFASRGAAEEKAILQLARSCGIAMFAASGSEQFASEFGQLGHGIFTYSILEGLKGSADGSTKDGKITVSELKAFIDDKVPELTQKYKGQAQYPQSIIRGMDFPIIVIK